MLALRATSPAEAARIGKESSTLPVRSAFYGLGAVDLHFKLANETMHNHSLGVTKALMGILELSARATLGATGAQRLADALNTDLAAMPT